MEKTTGIVIKCKDYSETSQLVWLYTKDFGKIKLVAKGSRTRSKKFQGKIDLFNVIEIVFYKSIKGELHTLGECSVKEAFEPIRNDLNRFALSSYIAELIDAMTPLEDPNDDIFLIALQAMRNVCKGMDIKFVQSLCEIKLLHCTGSFPNIDARTDISNGVKAMIKMIRYSKTADRVKPSPVQLDELGRILRIIIDYSLGKRLKSLTFFNNLEPSSFEQELVSATSQSQDFRGESYGKRE
jgi:DNA repair protein RecO (recombination protein O)